MYDYPLCDFWMGVRRFFTLAHNRQWTPEFTLQQIRNRCDPSKDWGAVNEAADKLLAGYTTHRDQWGKVVAFLNDSYIATLTPIQILEQLQIRSGYGLLHEADKLLT